MTGAGRPKVQGAAGAPTGTVACASRILLLDDVVSSRIVLRARLTAAAHEVVAAVSEEEGLAALEAGRVGLVILAGSFAALSRAEALCLRLNAAQPQAPPVLILGAAGADEDPAGRLRLLAAGAAGCLPASLDGPALLAHLRALLRRKRGAGGRLPADLGWPAAQPAPAGLADAAAPFVHAGRARHDARTPSVGKKAAAGWLALVAAHPAEAVALRTQLDRLLAQRLVLFRPDEILPALRNGPAPEAVLILASAPRRPSSGLAAVAELHLLAELRARESSARTPVLLLGAAAPEVSILALDLGAQEVLPLGFTAQELALRLQQCLSRTQARSRERAQRELRLAEELRQASIDALTGVANRRACLRRLDALHADASVQAAPPYALLLLDIDRFKQVNDTWGHAAGDEVLAGVAARLAEPLGPDDLLGRIGGEEFLIALPGTEAAAARAVADTLRRRIEARPFALTCGAEVRVTVSVGLALPQPGESRDEALAEADRALYAAKARGRNMVWAERPAA